MAYTSYSDLYSLEEISFIAGTTFNLDFKLKDTSGNFINLVGKTFTWKMSPFGAKGSTTLTKTGITLISDDYTVRITLSPSDTQSLSGKYVHQISFVSDDIINAAWELFHTQLLTASPQTVTTGITQPSFPRFATIQSDNSGTTGNVQIIGTDENDASVNETIALSGTVRVSGSQMFKTITQINYPASSGHTITVGGGSYVESTTYIPSQGIIIISPKIGV